MTHLTLLKPMKRLLPILGALVTGSGIRGTTIALPMSRSGIFGIHGIDHGQPARRETADRSGKYAAGVIRG